MNRNSLFSILFLFFSAVFFYSCASKTPQAPAKPQASVLDRTKPPQPGPAPTINIPDAVAYTLPNGMKLFVVSNTRLPLVSATLTIDGKPQAYGSLAGLNSMAGRLLRRGTTTLPKAKLDEEVDFLGGSLNTSAWSVNAYSLKRNFSALMKLMADVALRPELDNGELEKVRTEMISEITSDKDDPAAISRNITNALVYGKNHPYGEIVREETVKNITSADVRNFYNTWWKPNLAYLVMVGDIQPEEAHRMALEHFGNWQSGPVPQVEVPAFAQPAKTFIAIVDRPEAVQSTIVLASPVQLKLGSPNSIAAVFTGQLLGTGISSRLNQNLRESKGFTYGAGGGVRTDRYAGSFIASADVRKEKTDSAVGEFIYEFNRIRNELPETKELDFMKSYVGGDFARRLENPSTIAQFALNTAQYNLPADYYRNYLQNLQAITPQQVNTMAQQYVPVNNLVITVVGDAAAIAPGLEKYGEVLYFDMYGNPAEKRETGTADSGVTAQSVLQHAIEGYGGLAALEKVKDIEIDGNASIMGQQLKYNQKTIRPDKTAITLRAGIFNLMEQMKNGDAYKNIQQGREVAVDEGTRHDLSARAMVFEELYWLNTPGYSHEITGTEKMDGGNAYKMKITAPGGSEHFSFFDEKTGYRLKDVRTQDMGPMGAVVVNTYYYDYKNHEGIFLPTRVVIDLGVARQEMNITEVRINKGVKESDFK